MNIPGMTPERHEKLDANGTWLVTVTPPHHIQPFGVTVLLSSDQHHRYLVWRTGAVTIDRALPDLNRNEREALISGLADDTGPGIPLSDDGVA